ncbi:MAG: hypothetical protein M3R55_13545 [Acidobacteriota bacterium]|nr:hypothetical protein [Acidobacteriota bacterium]
MFAPQQLRKRDGSDFLHLAAAAAARRLIAAPGFEDVLLAMQPAEAHDPDDVVAEISLAQLARSTGTFVDRISYK